jgi:UvrB domain 3
MNPGLKGRDLRDAFATDEYNVMLVANKFQTGFDQPVLVALYVDKRLSGVAAVQTLSRLNRVAPGKDQTYVLDFANTAGDIVEAFEPYYGATTLADPRGRANGTRVHRSQYRYALRPGGYQLASLHAVNPEGQERSRMRCMELTEALVTQDITPFERERLREALEEEVRRQLPADSQLLRVVDWDPAGGHAVENPPGMRKYRVAYETEPRD